MEKPGGPVTACKSQGWFCIQKNIFSVRFVKYKQGGALSKINLLAAKVITSQLASHRSLPGWAQANTMYPELNLCAGPRSHRLELRRDELESLSSPGLGSHMVLK